MSPDRLELVMRMEADRMAGLRITEKELIPERQVVLEERRMRTDNSPSALLDEAVREQLFGRHKPYGMPVIGYVDDVKRLSVGDLTAFYAEILRAQQRGADRRRRHHGRAGAQARREALRADRRPQGRAAPPSGRGRARPAAARDPRRCPRGRAALVADYLAPSYRMGETQHAYALQVLAQLFGGGETSRLWRALVVDRKLALSTWASYSPTSLGLTSFDLGVHPAPTSTMAEVETAVGGQIGKLIDGGVTPEEVERAQNQLLAAAIYSQELAGERPAHLRRDARHRRHHRRHRRLAAAHLRRHADRCRSPPRAMSGAPRAW